MRQGLTTAPPLSSITKGELMSTKHLRNLWELLPFIGWDYFNLALTAWRERGGSATSLCRLAGGELPAASQASGWPQALPVLPSPAVPRSLQVRSLG